MLRRLSIVAAALLGLVSQAGAELVQPPPPNRVMAAEAQWERLTVIAEQARRSGNYDDAERACAKAGELAKSFPQPDTHFGQSQGEMGYIKLSQFKYEDAERLFKEAIASCEKAGGPNDPGVEISLDGLVNCYYGQKKFAQAVPVCERVVSIAQYKVNRQNRELSRRLQGLSGAYFSNGQYDQAKSVMKDAIDLAHLCGDQESEMQYRLIAGRSCETIHDNPAALEQYAAGLELSTQGSNSDMTFQFQQAIADVCRVTGDFARAEKMAKRSLAMREKEAVPGTGMDTQLNLAVCRENLGKIYLAWSRPTEAEAQYAEAVSLVETAHGAETGELARYLADLADAEHAEHSLDKAAGHYQQAIEIAKKSADPARLADLYEKYAGVVKDQNHPDEAKALMEHARGLRTAASQPATATAPAPALP